MQFSKESQTDYRRPKRNYEEDFPDQVGRHQMICSERLHLTTGWEEEKEVWGAADLEH